MNEISTHLVAAMVLVLTLTIILLDLPALMMFLAYPFPGPGVDWPYPDPHGSPGDAGHRPFLENLHRLVAGSPAWSA